MDYAVGVIHEEGGVFGISFPDFPGCISTARSLNHVIEKGGQALALHVAGMIEDGESVPVLHSPGEFRADPQFADWFADAIVCAIAVEIPRRAVRVNISIDEALLESLDRAAGSVGQTRSAYLAEAVKRRISAGEPSAVAPVPKKKRLAASSLKTKKVRIRRLVPRPTPARKSA